ncbi:MAG: DUF1592 domain-containing protein [Bryobacter sp.]
MARGGDKLVSNKEMFLRLASLVFLPLLSLVAADAPPSPNAKTFDETVKPLLTKSCSPCHNDRNQSGGVNILPFTNPLSMSAYRDDWERIIRKMRSGEMPPKGFPRPAEAQMNGLIGYVHQEFEKADAALQPDPGRVTARRLNRTEYSNTIRDLLGVNYRAERDFPADDSGHGFDNIGDVLTISPMLMEKYLEAAEKISARALGITPFPKKPVEVEYHTKDRNLSRLGPSAVATRHDVEWDAEYKIIIGMPGERPEGQPVELVFLMDGKPIHTQMVETKPSGLVYFNPYSEAEFRVFLPSGDHEFRAEFRKDPFVKTLAKGEVYDQKKNKTMHMIKFVGPYASEVVSPSRQAILACDLEKAGCMKSIVGRLARRAWRRPVTEAEVARLVGFAEAAMADGQSREQALSVSMTAMLVSPHFLFRLERDQHPNDPTKSHPISDLELASRLSYFLWASMPDEELLRLAERKKLRAPGVLDAQIRRMLASEKSRELAFNFAGQWLETRNLSQAKPDPKRFPEWGPELREAMQQETALFFDAVLKENLPISTFLDAKFTFLNEVLARHYGIEGVEGADFRRVELTPDQRGNQRGGLLTHASVLTVSSYPTRTSPVIRGTFLLENIFGTPPPPPDVPLLDEEKIGANSSLRKQLEQHRANAMCASCHNRMDVMGFALENYDATGKWREKDGNFEIDPAGTLPNGKSFKTPAELRAVLAADVGEFGHALTEKMLTYALGRGMERFDRKTVNELTKKMAAEGWHFQNLIFEIARSLPFQSKRAEYTKNNQTVAAK